MTNERLDAAKRLSDGDLLRKTKDLAARERGATADLIAHLAEVDARRLYLGEGHGSLFSYCTAELLMSEHEACNRIEAARAVRRFPDILPRLVRGEINLTTVRLLAPHLSADNHVAVLDEARGLAKRDVLVLIARLAPQPDVPPSVRKLPAASMSFGSSDDPVALTGEPPPVVASCPPERYRVQFTASKQTHDKFRRLQGHLRREIRDGDPALIFDRALTLLLDRVERRRITAGCFDGTRSARPAS